MKKKIKITFYILLGIYIILSSILGFSTIINAIVIYFILFKTCKFVLFKITKDKEKRINYTLLLISLFIGLTLSEISLRSFTKKYSTYLEKNYFQIYFSPFNTNQRKLINRYSNKKDPNLWIRKPNLIIQNKSTEFNYLHQYNSFGLRGNEPSINDSTELIISLGDSFTEGIGTPNDSTWSNLLLNKIIQDNQNYEIINGGMGGSDVFYEYYKLKNYLLGKLSPSTILLAINSSDIYDVITRGNDKRFNPKYKNEMQPWWEPLYGISFIFRAFIHDVLKKEWHLYNQEEFKALQTKAQESICSCLLNDFNQLSIENEFELIVIFSPNVWELDNNENQFLECEQKLNKKGIVTINLFDTFIKKENYQSFFWKKDLHNNSKGYQVWANVIYNKIENK